MRRFQKSSAAQAGLGAASQIMEQVLEALSIPEPTTVPDPEETGTPEDE